MFLAKVNLPTPAAPFCAYRSARPSVFVMACEPSGDWLGSQLISAVQHSAPGVRFLGLGGPLMEAAGQFTSLIPMEELAVMGFVRVIANLPRLLGIIRHTVAAIYRAAPWGVLSIDGPDFCLRVGRRITGIPRLHCVAPSVWAWRPGRAKTVVPAGTDGLLSLFPFEAPYFAHMGYTFVGHPVLCQPPGDGARFFQRFGAGDGLRPDRPLLCLLAGSRRQEIESFFTPFVHTYRLLSADHPGLQAVVVTPPSMEHCVRDIMKGMQLCAPVVHDDQVKRDAFAASTAALAASGTVTLELARQCTPMVIGYRVDRITAWALKRLVRVPHVGLINIVAQHAAGAYWDGTPLVPECLQENFTPSILANKLSPLLTDTPQRRQQCMGLKTALDSLWAGQPFATAGAQAILRAFSLPSVG